MHHKHIIQSLPLLASVLGRKYGVEVHIGGSTACTNGTVIQLPSLPLECDETLLGLVRGYIDHESAHIRHTDFSELKKAKLTELEKHIWNIIEDWRVESCLARLYPGCKQNFAWLIRHFFLGQQHGGNDPAENILRWLLLTVRMWDVPELLPDVQRVASAVDTVYPGLVSQLSTELQNVKANCLSTCEAIRYAKAIVGILQQYITTAEHNEAEACGNSSLHPHNTNTQASSSTVSKQVDAQALQELQHLIVSGTGEFSSDIGEELKEVLSRQCVQQQGKICVAVPITKERQPLRSEEIQNCRQATTALRTRLQSCLQSTKVVRKCSGYSGTLNSHKLYSLRTGNAKIFLKCEERQALNTAIHILLDSSGSMMGPAMELANLACFAVATALHGIKGITLGVTAFPGGKLPDTSTQQDRWNTIAPVLHHNQKIHTNFGLTAAGDTPMAAALFWVLQQMYPLPQPRKIILLLTDGAPNDYDATERALTLVKQSGIEVFGIGILDSSVTNILPKKDTTVIHSLTELAPAMFAMLQNVLIKL